MPVNQNVTKYDIDADPSKVHRTGEFKERVAVIRTSDRMSFKACRRKWNWSSGLRFNLEPKQSPAPLWYGTGIHYALEDYHGAKDYSTIIEGFEDYIYATRKNAHNLQLPDEWEELRELGMATLSYYADRWLSRRDPYETFVLNGEPQVEVNFLVDIPNDWRDRLVSQGITPDYDRAIYSGTIDRVVIDPEDGKLWLQDYKTAKQMKSSHYENDPQVTSYCWAAYHIYQRPIGGMIYHQFSKTAPKGPRELKNGTISLAQNQVTSHTLYRDALIEKYGTVMGAPKPNVDYLNSMAAIEDENRDKFIRRDRIWKNPHSLEVEGSKILMECEDMLNPNLPLYPNPGWTCPLMCSFYEECVSMDDGSDWEHQLKLNTQERAKTDESWRKYLQNDIKRIDLKGMVDADVVDLTKEDFV